MPTLRQKKLQPQEKTLLSMRIRRKQKNQTQTQRQAKKAETKQIRTAVGETKQAEQTWGENPTKTLFLAARTN